MREIRSASNEIKRDIQNSAMEMRKDLKTQNPLEDLPKLDNILDEHPTPKISEAKSEVEGEDQPLDKETEA